MQIANSEELAAIDLSGAVDLLHVVDAGFGELLVQIAGGGHVFGEDEHLVLFEHAVVAEKLEKRAEFLVLLGLELAQLVEELDDLIEVVVGIIEDGGDVKVIALEFPLLRTIEKFGGDDIFVRFLYGGLVGE
ncbi:MAG: hypothetical protein IH991_24615 [Planctomycetes bacterium]|nr:hypothetical protein [Planctomycetota bacterium]